MNAINQLAVLQYLDSINMLGGREDMLSGVFGDVTIQDAQRQTGGRACKFIAQRLWATGDGTTETQTLCASVETIASDDDRMRVVWSVELENGDVQLLDSPLNAKTALISVRGKAIKVTGHAPELVLGDDEALGDYLAESLLEALPAPARGYSVAQKRQHASAVVKDVHEARYENGGIMQGKAKAILG